jgi:magnesium transporter
VPAVVDELERVDDLTRALAFRALPKDRALAVFEDLDPSVQSDLIAGLRERTVLDLVDALDHDDRARLLDELPSGLATKLLQGVSRTRGR